MAKPTSETVWKIASHLQGTDVTVFIDDAYEDVLDVYKVPDDKAERPTRYLAAHLATLDVRRTLSEKSPDFQITYDKDSAAGTGLMSTPYGQEFLRLMDRYKSSDGGSGLNLLVI